MKRTVSHKETGTLTDRCASCGLFYEYLHVGASGRDLCRLCLELAGENRPDPQHGRWSAGQVTR
jgi:hypothetical protein